jgi:hypothetical protein
MFDHYRQIDESKRLSSGAGELEQIRTKELIERASPKNRSVIVDVGGAAASIHCGSPDRDTKCF